MITNNRIRTFRILILGLICWLGTAATAVGDIRIAVLTSDSLTSTNRTWQGARKAISRRYAQATFYRFQVNQSPHDALATIDSVHNLEPTLVLTIGSSATQFAQDNFPNIPTVFAAVMYPVLSGFVKTTVQPGGNITGASIDVPIDVQFRYFRRIVPDLKRIGVLYTDSTRDLIPPASDAARGLNLDLVPLKVQDIKNLGAALDSLAKTVDGIWSLADPNLFDSRSTRFILLNALRKGIPFMGFSRNVVASGALFALDFDYKAVGSQAGEIANRVISGEEPREIGVTSADVIWFHYNEKTAKHIGIIIPEELVAIAKEVYR
ncbi:MAG: ABC transporter substrate-binding protein [bacterium]